MNLYLRYFDDEIVVSNMEEAISFLQSLKIEDFDINDEFINDLREFVDSSASFPKRYKIKAHNYFIVIKTNALTLEEFKRNNVKALLESEADSGQTVSSSKKMTKEDMLLKECPGWYDGQLNFKRVICVPSTGKFQYRDTSFRALVRAQSVQHCYERIVEYLRTRTDIDQRSQYPSIKGKNFSCTYKGETKPVNWE